MLNDEAGKVGGYPGLLDVHALRDVLRNPVSQLVGVAGAVQATFLKANGKSSSQVARSPFSGS